MKSLNVRNMGGAAKQAGFTIIELVVVILLLGILTATALPRFLDISDDAHGAVVDAHLGALATGVALYRAAWFAQNKRKNTAVDYLGSGTGTLFASDEGYPADIAFTAAGNFPKLHSTCVTIFNTLMQQGGTALTAGAAKGTDASAGDSAANPEGLILTAATDWLLTDGDWAAQVISAAPAAAEATAGCDFYYMGRDQATGATVRVIRYLPFTGALSIINPSDALGTAI